VITSDDLATLVIRRVIFHDVPKNVRKGSAKPDLSDLETNVSDQHKYHLQKKLTRVINSKYAYAIQFQDTPTSPLPGYVRDLTKTDCKSKDFIAASRDLANQLFDRQTGTASAGLLCTIDAVAGGRAAMIFMKLERENGAQLHPTGEEGKKTFTMNMLDDLFLTDGTKLFKAAMFLRTGKGDDDFRATVCDDQLNVLSSNDVAHYWMSFLGCSMEVAPRVATQRFFDSTLEFLSTAVSDSVMKSGIYEALQTELRSQKATFSPQSFISEHVPPELKKIFREHLKTDGVPLTAFSKDVTDIKGKLKRRAYETTKGGFISVPEEIADIVEIHPNDILVKDSVLKVK
jgi:hypothetical protein